MKKICILILFVELMSCNNPQNSNDKKYTTTEVNKEDNRQNGDEISYYNAQQRFRIIDFVENKDTFRIVPDTTNHKFNVYLQKKINNENWNNIDTFHCRQVGIRLIDWNEDSYVDINNELKWWNEVKLYNPKTRKFTNKIEIGGSSILPVIDKIKYDIGGYPHSDTSESRLFKFENYDMKVYAQLKLIFKAGSDYSKVEKIELYSRKAGDKKLINTWKQNDFPKFIKNNGEYDYFETHEFVEYFWKKNWSKYIVN